MWSFYLDTHSRNWGGPYLNRRFFRILENEFAHKVVMSLAYLEDKIVAGALHLRGRDRLYGRYWGCVARIPFLHFELCYYQAIEYAIDEGLRAVEPGAGGEHKPPRGYEAVPTYSLHWIVDPRLRAAVAEFLRREKGWVREERADSRRHTPFRRGPVQQGGNDG